VVHDVDAVAEGGCVPYCLRDENVLVAYENAADDAYQ